MAKTPKDGESFNDSWIKNIGYQESLEYRINIRYRIWKILYKNFIFIAIIN